jgi:hypothetical protein
MRQASISGHACPQGKNDHACLENKCLGTAGKFDNVPTWAENP